MSTLPRLTGRRCRCTACGLHFATVRGFDRHRLGPFGKGRRCYSPLIMMALGWRRSEKGFWMPPKHRVSAAPYPRTWDDIDRPGTPVGGLPSHRPNREIGKRQ
jgi:hypothetical protein